MKSQKGKIDLLEKKISLQQEIKEKENELENELEKQKELESDFKQKKEISNLLEKKLELEKKISEKSQELEKELKIQNELKNDQRLKIDRKRDEEVRKLLNEKISLLEDQEKDKKNFEDIKSLVNEQIDLIERNEDIEKLLNDSVSHIENREESQKLISEMISNLETIENIQDKLELENLDDEDFSDLVFETEERENLLLRSHKKFLILQNKTMEEEETNFGGTEENEEDDKYDWDYLEALDWIDNPEFKEKTAKILENIDYEKRTKKVYNNALLDAVEYFQLRDILIDEEWDKDIIKNEREKLKWETKILALNEAFTNMDITIPYDDKKINEFLKENLQPTFSDKNEELNGFSFLGEKIVKRNRKRNFYAVESPTLERFLEAYNNLIDNRASSTFIENLGGTSRNSADIKAFADNYIFELREEQKRLGLELTPEENIELKDFRNNIREINEIEKEIDDIKKNKKFKIRLKIWGETVGGKVKDAIRWFKRVAKNIKNVGFGVIAAIVGVLISIGAFITQIELEMKKGAAFMEAIGKKFKELKDYISNNPLKSFAAITTILGYFLGAFGYFMQLSTFLFSIIFTRFAFLFIIGVGLILSIFTSFLDELKKGFDFININFLKLRMEISLMNDESPPEEVIKPLAEEKNMTETEYRKEFASEKNYYNSTLAKVASVPITPIAYVGDKLSKSSIIAEISIEGVTYTLEIIQKYLYYIVILFVIFIIIKWRN